MNSLKGQDMSSIESAIGVLIAKVGWLKFSTFAAALAGAAVMIVFRPPATRKEMFLQGVIALSASFMFGPFFVKVAQSWTGFGVEDVLIPTHALVGALSWGAFGGVAAYRDKLSSSPKEAVQDVKDVI